VIKGIGDDCAVLKYRNSKHLLFATDILVEGVHFARDKATPEEIGRKALAVNISDIAACGGLPKHAVVSVALPLGFRIITLLDYTRALRAWHVILR